MNQQGPAGPQGDPGKTGPQGDPGTDTLGSLECMDGEIAKYNAASTLWECAADEPSEPQIEQLVIRDGSGKLVGEILNFTRGLGCYRTISR